MLAGLPFKALLLDAAEVADAWRLVPRLLMAGYGWMLWSTWVWFRALEDPTVAQSAYVSTLWGAAAVVSGFYFNTGRKWTS